MVAAKRIELGGDAESFYGVIESEMIIRGGYASEDENGTSYGHRETGLAADILVSAAARLVVVGEW